MNISRTLCTISYGNVNNTQYLLQVEEATARYDQLSGYNQLSGPVFAHAVKSIAEGVTILNPTGNAENSANEHREPVPRRSSSVPPRSNKSA